MDSGIDLNPPPLGLLLPEDDSFFWEGEGLKSLLLFSSKSGNFASSGLGQPLINCSYGAMSKWPAGHLAPF